MGAGAFELVVPPALLLAAPGTIGHGVLEPAAAPPVAPGVVAEALCRLERLFARESLLVDAFAAPGAVGEFVGNHPPAVVAFRAGELRLVPPDLAPPAAGAERPVPPQLGAA